MSVKSVYIEDQEQADNIANLLAQAGMDIPVSKIMNHYVTDITTNLPADEQFIVESCVMQALGHVMSDISGNSGHQTCSCGAEWKFWYSRYGLEREPVNDLARNHDTDAVRNFILHVRLSGDEQKKIQSISDEKDISMSEYARQQIFPKELTMNTLRNIETGKFHKQTGKIEVELGIDSAQYQDDNKIDLTEYATAVAKRVREEFPGLRFSFSASEDDNATTQISWNDDNIEFTNLADEIKRSIEQAESIEYPDEGNWTK